MPSIFHLTPRSPTTRTMADNTCAASPCRLTSLPIELQLVLVDKITAVSKHHLRLTGRHFRNLLPAFPLQEVRDSAAEHGLYDWETPLPEESNYSRHGEWEKACRLVLENRSKMCENCTVVKWRTEFPAGDRYLVGHLQDMSNIDETGTTFLEQEETLKKVAALRVKSMTGAGVPVCRDCGTGKGGKEPKWPGGVWGYLSPHSHDWEVFCAKCGEIEPVDKRTFRIQEARRYCRCCWDYVRESRLAQERKEAADKCFEN